VITLVGCFRCGLAQPKELSLYAQCTTCGKKVGICLGCSLEFPLPATDFLRESIEFHIEMKHPAVAWEVGKRLLWQHRPPGMGLKRAGAQALAAMAAKW
jgi:hypothetical protein